VHLRLGGGGKNRTKSEVSHSESVRAADWGPITRGGKEYVLEGGYWRVGRRWDVQSPRGLTGKREPKMNAYRENTPCEEERHGILTTGGYEFVKR